MYSHEYYLPTFILTSDSRSALGQTKGHYVGYHTVQVTQCEDEDCQGSPLGQTVYEYSSSRDYKDTHTGIFGEGLVRSIPCGITPYIIKRNFINGIPETENIYPYPPKTSYDWKRGLLKRESYLDADNSIRREVSYEYNPVDEAANYKVISGIKVVRNQVISGLTCPEFTQNNLVYGKYDIIAAWDYQTKKVETFYESDGSSSTTEVNYYYDDPDHLQLNRIVTIDSQGKQLITENKYALDFPDGSPELGSKLLQGNHMHSQILEQTTKVFKNDGTEIITGKTRTTYSDETGHVLPKFIESFPDGTNAAPKLNYNYDEFGNLKEVLRDYDVPTSYLWGYNNSLPIAKIVGASYSEVESALGGATSIEDLQTMDEQALRDALDVLRNSLPDAMVTTYTYDPLIGMTSATDPNGRTTKYTYDDFGRLWHTKDHEGNIIQTYEYNYKQ